MTRRCVIAVTVLQTLVLTNFDVGAFLPRPVLRAALTSSEALYRTSLAAVSSASGSRAKPPEESVSGREEGQRRTPKEIAGEQQQPAMYLTGSNPSSSSFGPPSIIRRDRRNSSLRSISRAVS